MSDLPKQILEFIKSGWKVASIVAVAAGAALILIDHAPVEVRLALQIVLCLTCATVAVSLVEGIWVHFRDKRQGERAKTAFFKFMENLTGEEKRMLLYFVSNDKRQTELESTDPLVIGMTSRGLLVRKSGSLWSTYEVRAEVWDYIRENWRSA